jgi:EAL domain-containing protein (putative c-di-GMP-specific phosphodiesterase class I)
MTQLCAKNSDTTWTLCGQVVNNEPIRKIPVHATPFRIGRLPDLGLCVQCPTVSKIHAELSLCDQQLIVRDLDSTNGTFINGQRVTGSQQLQEGDLLQIASLVFRVAQESGPSRTETLMGADCEDAMALIRFDRLIADREVVPFFQPIVRSLDHTILGYEVLGRSEVYGLKTPHMMFRAATQLNLEVELSRLFRTVGLEAGRDLPQSTYIFLNSHPSEMKEMDSFVDSLQELRKSYPSNNIALEIHESTITDPRLMIQLRRMLDELSIGLAYDDFGAGQSRLLELVEVPPDFLKFDITMIKNIDQAAPARRQMLRSLVNMVHDLGITPLAEGVETVGEAHTCIDLGFQLGQGFYFGRPAPIGAWHESI